LNEVWKQGCLRVAMGVANTLGWRSGARHLLQHSLEADPDDPYVLATLAHEQSLDGAWPQARDTLLRCTELQPHDGRAWFNLGYVCEQLQRTEEAERCFRVATQLAPELDRAWYGLGLALIAQDRLSEAAQALRVNTRLQPMSPYGWYQLGRVQADLGACDEAAATIARLREFEPKVARQLERETGLCAR
jgi:Flp pilus assembly protein TadD